MAMNVEGRVTNVERMTKFRMTKSHWALSTFEHSSFVRHASFVIRHSHITEDGT
jgi:hypothetical protein